MTPAGLLILQLCGKKRAETGRKGEHNCKINEGADEGVVLVVHVGDDDVAAGAQDAGELLDDRLQVGQVGQGQRAQDEVDFFVCERQVVEVALAEVGGGDLRPGVGEHARRAVDADHRVTLARARSSATPW